MAKRLLFVILGLLIVFGVIFGVRGYQIYSTMKFYKNKPEPAMVISTTKASTQTWSPTLSSVGTFQSVNGVNVTSQVAGQVVKIYFQSGQMVKKGQLLVKLDDATDVEELHSLMATMKNAKTDYERVYQLYSKYSDHGGMSKSALDTKRASYLNAKAMVAKQKQLIAYKQIKAPFAGKVGMRDIDLGQFINPGAGFVYLQQINPLLLRFNLPEQDIALVKLKLPIIATVDTYPNKTFHGAINAISSRVDPDTHMITIQASLPNKAYELYPGMFARITIMLSEEKSVVVLPQTAVTYTSYGDTVYTVTSDGQDKTGKPILRAYPHFVETGDKRGNQVVILTGIKAGDLVVTSGQLKLSQGMRVSINNSVKLDAQ